MAEKKINSGLIFILVFLFVVGAFLLYSRLNFTGFVVGGTVTASNFSAGTFEATKFDSTENAIILDNSSKGNYTSQALTVEGMEMIWNYFNYVGNVPSNSSLLFLARACPDAACSGVAFSPMTPGNISIRGKYFQYKAEMQGVGVSPKIFNVTYSTTVLPSIYGTIESPQSTTYTNGSVLIKISSEPNSSVIFSNGTANETYTGEVYKTFANGQYTITIYVSDTNGNVNSSSVTFTIAIPLSCGDGICSPQNDEDYLSCAADCPKPVASTNLSGEETSEEITTICTPNWQYGDWSACASGTQTRTGTDANSCGTEAPIQSQACTVETTATTTETTTTTQKKGFLTIVGNVISAPFNKVPRAIFSVLVILIVMAFLVSKFYFKKDLLTLAKRFLKIRRRADSA